MSEQRRPVVTAFIRNPHGSKRPHRITGFLGDEYMTVDPGWTLIGGQIINDAALVRVTPGSLKEATP